MPGGARPLSSARASAAARSTPGALPSYWHQFADSEGPVPAATPLLLGGFSARVRTLVGELLRDFSLIPIEAGGGGRRLERAGPRPFVPGSPIGVQLVRGDLSATGIGTVTSVRGSQVLAFGHPMFGYGQQHYPVSTARIITIISSRRRSFKLGEPLAEAGALIQDRQSCIIADTSGQGPMTQLVVRAHDRSSGRRDQFDLEVVRERFLLPVLSLSSVASALDRFASDRSDLMVSMRGELHLARGRTLVLEDEAFTERGATDTRTLLNMRPLSALNEILNNPFEEAQLDRVVLDVSMEYRRDEAEIIGAYVTAEQLLPGATVPVHVVVRPYGGPEELRVVPLELPLATAGQEIELQVDGGSSVSPPMPVPQSLEDLLDNIERGAYPATSLVVTLKRRAPWSFVTGPHRPRPTTERLRCPASPRGRRGRTPLRYPSSDHLAHGDGDFWSSAPPTPRRRREVAIIATSDSRLRVERDKLNDSVE